MKIRRYLASIFSIFTIAALNAQNTVSDELLNITDSSVQIELTEQEKAAVEKHKTLRVVIDPAWPPLEFNGSTDPGSFNEKGINIEILKELAAIYDIKLNFIPTGSYAESIQYILNGKADIISGYVRLLDQYPQIKQSSKTYRSQLLMISTTGHYPEEGDTVGITEFPQALLERLHNEIGIKDLKFDTNQKPEITLERFRNGKYKYIIIGQAELSYADNLPKHTAYNLSLSYSQQFAFNQNMEDSFISAFNKAINTFSYSNLNLIFYKVQSQHQNEKQEQLKKREQRHNMSITFLSNSVIIALVIIMCMMTVLRHKLHEITYDDVTGLHTYSRFRRDVLKILKNHKSENYLFLSLNIDDFGFINDSYGFNYGNRILALIAKHFIEECTKGEKYCRYYADTFIFFMKDPLSMPLIEDRVFKLTDVSDHIAQLLPKKYVMTFSSGVYYVTDNNDRDITGMVTKANIARKMNKKNFITHRTAEYTLEMKKENDWNREITLSMNKALENREFVVYYQPKFSLRTKKIIGAEALIRWNKPETGLLGPDRFVPLFEHNGFIEKIDIYVFNDVCRFMNEWNKCMDGKCPYPITISFNLSRYHLYDSDLIEKLTGISREYNIDPSYIEVELTESIMFDNMKRLVRVMNDIKKAGFKISVDDFGSGYSSLNILKNMPADVIKLDKEFLPNAQLDEKDSIIIESVISMAKKLNMQTVAEGIETEQQSKLLAGIGCDIAQGFFFARPMPGEAFMELLKKYI
ncbi:EAL domain-containing protein [Treponema rectale]|uniref:EAL domain-containing protein n=1 Tax=Treponema rectale TaxID=744512 RepID=A0A840S6P8_9SPIR|nr:EAL domain-containing protein [Treponema rectale]MBB5218229.1 EAL domain-containing protein (putative c-di-GMP-specific phosphodiesterase class I) [Treponema rectale]QOS40068.1 EAL domain-containing protein [Treponema rectale]